MNIITLISSAAIFYLRNSYLVIKIIKLDIGFMPGIREFISVAPVIQNEKRS